MPPPLATESSPLSGDQQPNATIALRNGFVAASLLVGISLLAPAKYEANDDFRIITILAGLDGFDASTEAPFISKPLSVMLWGLYQLLPGLPWYGIALYLTLFVGTWSFCGVLFLDSIDRAARWCAAPALLALIGHCMYSVTFTSATLLTEFGGLLLLLTWLTHGPSLSTAEAPADGVLRAFLSVAIEPGGDVSGVWIAAYPLLAAERPETRHAVDRCRDRGADCRGRAGFEFRFNFLSNAPTLSRVSQAQ